MKARNFFKKNGFYVTLGLSAVLIGTATYFAYNQVAGKVGNEFDKFFENTKPQETYDVGKNAESVPKNTAPFLATAPVLTPAPGTVIPPKSPETAEKTEAAAAPAPDEGKVMPLAGEVINIFSGTELVKSITTGAWQTHNGADIAGNPGDSVCAIASGTVLEVKDDALWGVCVTVDHSGGIVSRYCGLNSGVTVQAGEEVARGQEIGAVGECEIELAIPSHLHLEVQKNGNYIDPIGFILN
ncbi:MAG: M23 family metallopeptidase [Oscillospiraceae bacterium]|jgi:murein DD-endopeptidase MepM/ murein hydrolase activator NlpD|nr:M23 family metallopeptidase [Oscillospiraceae bacterium]